MEESKKKGIDWTFVGDLLKTAMSLIEAIGNRSDRNKSN